MKCSSQRVGQVRLAKPRPLALPAQLAAALFPLVLLPFTHWAKAAPSPEEQARRIFNRLAGVPILRTDPRLRQMTQAISAGRPSAAAEIATEDESFYRFTARSFATIMSGTQSTRDLPLDDFIATVVGAIRDELDARTLLTGDFRYIGYEEVDAKGLSLKQTLKRQSPQWQDLSEPSGLLTTWSWANAHYAGGTNRRPVDFSLKAFLCTSVKELANSNYPDDWVRWDVDREPGGSSKTYQTTCRGCHSGMDAIAGAFARVDFRDNMLRHSGGKVQDKVRRSALERPFADAQIVENDSWVNYWVEGSPEVGWPETLRSGVGIRTYGEMLSRTRAFASCMVKRVYREVCLRDPSGEDMIAVTQLAGQFEADGYKLRKLFARVAVQPGCIWE